MTCEELRQDYTAYALGIADDPERTEIAATCSQVPELRARSGSAMATVTAMSGAVKLTEPPKYLRRRVMASVAKEPKRWRAASSFRGRSPRR